MTILASSQCTPSVTEHDLNDNAQFSSTHLMYKLLASWQVT